MQLELVMKRLTNVFYKNTFAVFRVLLNFFLFKVPSSSHISIANNK